MSNDKLTVVESIVFAAFAGLGGLLSYLLRSLNRDQKPSLSKSIVETLSSGFVGVLAMLCCKALNIDILWSGVIVGVFGWLGAEASIVMLAGLLRRKLGIDVNGDSKNP